MMKSTNSPSTLSGNSIHFCEALRDSPSSALYSSCSERSDSKRSEAGWRDHESFSTFKLRIELLCRLQWRSGLLRERKSPSISGRVKQIFSGKLALRSTTGQHFAIEEMHGGSFNRVYGITVTNETKPASPEMYVLRVPRYSDQHPASDAAVQQYVHRNYPTVPVATVVTVDDSRLNPLNEPYMIQTRLPGVSAHGVTFTYDDLAHDQQCRIASQLGKIMRDMFARKLDTPGMVEASTPLVPLHQRSQDAEPSQAFRIAPFPVGRSLDHPMFDPDEMSWSSVQPDYASPLVFMQSQFTRLTASAESRGEELEVEYYSAFSAIAAQLDAVDCLGRDDGYVLCHQDLNMSPHNILIGKDGKKDWNVTGIVDFDSAVIAPAFMACRSPTWLWVWDDDPGERDEQAGSTPETEQQRERKAAFEDVVGEQWLKFAYKPAYKVARSLCWFAMFGLHVPTWWQEADELIVAWRHLAPSWMDVVKFPGTGDGQDDQVPLLPPNIEDKLSSGWANETWAVDEDESSGSEGEDEGLFLIG